MAATIAAETRYIDNDGGPYSINAGDGSVTRYTILVSTADTGVYVGPQSMGNGNAFPTVGPGESIAGYPLTPNQEYTFDITVLVGNANGDDSGLYATTTNTGGAVISYVVLEKI